MPGRGFMPHEMQSFPRPLCIISSDIALTLKGLRHELMRSSLQTQRPPLRATVLVVLFIVTSLFLHGCERTSRPIEEPIAGSSGVSSPERDSQTVSTWRNSYFFTSSDDRALLLDGSYTQNGIFYPMEKRLIILGSKSGSSYTAELVFKPSSQTDYVLSELLVVHEKQIWSAKDLLDHSQVAVPEPSHISAGQLDLTERPDFFSEIWVGPRRSGFTILFFAGDGESSSVIAISLTSQNSIETRRVYSEAVGTVESAYNRETGQ